MFSKIVLGMTLSLSIGSMAYAHNALEAQQAGQTNQSVEEDVFHFASRFTVKVINRLGNIFDFNVEGGHGSGFLVEIRKLPNGEERGVIFTNKHVVARDGEMTARKVIVQFQTDTEIPEQVPAEVIYESRLNDFAVLEFNMNDLKRVKDNIRPVQIPEVGTPFYDFSKNWRILQGQDVLAHGSPLDSDAVATFGKITGKNSNIVFGDYIQTQTPINPGNSGGPLISLDVQPGYVVGMNTAKINGADNTGFAIPIRTLIEEYKAWRQNPRLARLKVISIAPGIASAEELEVLGADKVIEAHLPEFFLHARAAIKIEDADPKSNLKTGDIIISINGQMAKPSLYELQKIIHQSESPLQLEVVRNGQIVKVETPIEDVTMKVHRQEVDFVYLSGMVFRSKETGYFSRDLTSNVILAQTIASPEMADSAAKVPPFSLLVGISVEGQDYKIENLNDLKEVLKKHRSAKFIRLDIRIPVKGDPIQGVIYRNITSTILVPLLEVVLPSQFSVHRFAKQVSFAANKPETRVWRNGIRKKKAAAATADDCQQNLSTPISASFQPTYTFKM